MNDILELVGKVKRGRNRLKVFKAIDKPTMPSELVIKIYEKQSNTYFNLISRALAELKDLGLIEVINPKERTGRIYQLTKLGEKVIEKLR